MDKAPAYGAGDSGFESQYGLFFFCSVCFVSGPEGCKKELDYSGVMRESNSRPPAPEAGIIPLDQSPVSSIESGGKKVLRDMLELNQRPIGL